MRSFSTRTAGLLILILGVWGGIVPFIGHYFHFALGPDKAWSWTMGRLWLDILPAVAAIVGGLMLIDAGARPHARLGAWLAIAAGIWFAIGPEISVWWKAGGDQGAGHGSAHIQALEMLAYHTGLGALIAALGGFALPRFPVVATEAAAVPAAAAADAPATAVPARERAAAAPATAVPARERAAAAPAAEAPLAAREDAVTRSEPVVNDGQTTVAGGQPSQTTGAGGEPVATRTDVAHTTVRRRRGGLLSVFSRR